MMLNQSAIDSTTTDKIIFDGSGEGSGVGVDGDFTTLQQLLLLTPTNSTEIFHHDNNENITTLAGGFNRTFLSSFATTTTVNYENVSHFSSKMPGYTIFHQISTVFGENPAREFDFNESLSNGSTTYGHSSDIQLYGYGILLPIIVIFGLFGNFATVLIMTRPQMRASINTYLAGLAVFDSLVLICAMLMMVPIPYCYQFDIKAACYMPTSYPLLVVYPLSLIL